MPLLGIAVGMPSLLLGICAAVYAPLGRLAVRWVACMGGVGAARETGSHRLGLGRGRDVPQDIWGWSSPMCLVHL